MLHKKTDKQWIDSKGLQIPYTRVTTLERFKENAATALLKKAQATNTALLDLKAEMIKACNQAYALAMSKNNVDAGKTSKGNFTWFSFDRTVKVERNISDRIDFDSAGIDAAKIKFDEFLTGKLEGTDEMVRELVMHAFNSKKGKLDVKKVLSLLSFRDKIKANLFQEACDCIEGAIINPDSATYFRIALLQEDGKYKNLELNFSAI